jgi:DNA-binding MarR family transcriptional regulator
LKAYLLIALLASFALYTTLELIKQAEENLIIRAEIPMVDHSIYGHVIVGIYKFHYFVQDNASIFSLIAWILVGTLVWRGPIRKIFREGGFEYDHFHLMMKMRGGNTRKKILLILTVPKNRKQISEELGLDWKAIDRHIKTMIKYQFITEMVQVGNATFYVRSEKGTKFLETIDEQNSQK